MLTQATAFRLPFRDNSIHVIFTSPPYFGKRVYAGLQPQIWGGEPGCKHVWGEWQESHDVREETEHGKSRTSDRFYGEPSRRFNGNHQKHISGAFCQKCSAWLGHLGNEPTPQMYIDHLVLAGREFWRVLRDDGILFLNLGDSYSQSGGAQVLQTKNASHGLEGYRGNTPGFKPKDLLGIPHWAARAFQDAGWYKRVDIPWIKRNGMPESVMDRPGISHEYFFMLTKSERYYWDNEGVKQPASFTSHGGNGANPGNKQREIGQNINGSLGLSAHQVGASSRQFRTLDPWLKSLDHLIEKTLTYLAGLELVKEEGGLLRDDAGLPLALFNTTQPYPGSHYAVFPPGVVYDLLKGATSPRGACGACGKPWERVTEKEKIEPVDYNGKWTDQDKQASGRRISANTRARRLAGGPHDQPFPEAVTIGWRPGCSCEAEPGPSIVCDPFCGSGTVGEVCQDLTNEGHPLAFVGADLSGQYLAAHAAVRAEGRTTDAALAEAQARIRKRYEKKKDDLKAQRELDKGQLGLF